MWFVTLLGLGPSLSWTLASCSYCSLSCSLYPTKHIKLTTAEPTFSTSRRTCHQFIVGPLVISCPAWASVFWFCLYVCDSVPYSPSPSHLPLPRSFPSSFLASLLCPSIIPFPSTHSLNVSFLKFLFWPSLFLHSIRWYIPGTQLHHSYELWGFICRFQSSSVLLPAFDSFPLVCQPHIAAPEAVAFIECWPRLYLLYPLFWDMEPEAQEKCRQLWDRKPFGGKYSLCCMESEIKQAA